MSGARGQRSDGWLVSETRDGKKVLSGIFEYLRYNKGLLKNL